MLDCLPKIPWNKEKIVCQKAPLKLKDIWAIRLRLQLNHRTRELALFDLRLESKLRACDLVNLRTKDICHGDRVATRAIVLQRKTSLPVQFEITPPPRDAVDARIKATLIYRRTRNLRAVQLLLGHTKIESAVRYLGIEVEDALEIAEQTDI